MSIITSDSKIMDEDINYDNVKMDMSEKFQFKLTHLNVCVIFFIPKNSSCTSGSVLVCFWKWDSDSDRRSASSNESTGRKSSRYSRSSRSRSSRSRSGDSLSRSEDEDRSSRARSEALSGASEKFEPSGRKAPEVNCSNTVGKGDLEDENHSTSSHTEKRLSLSPRDRLSSSDSSSDSSEDSDDYYRKKRQNSSDHTDEEEKPRQSAYLCRDESRSPYNKRQPSSRREKSVDHSSSPYEKRSKRSRSPSSTEHEKRSRSPSSSITEVWSPAGGLQRHSRSPIEPRTQYSRKSPDVKNRGYQSSLYTDGRKSSRSPQRKSKRSSPYNKTDKRPNSPYDNRNIKSSSPRDSKRKANIINNKSKSRKSCSPRDTKRNQSRSPCSKDKQSRSRERSETKIAKLPDGPSNQKNVRSTSPRMLKISESPKRENADHFKSRSYRAKRSCSSSDGEVQKKVRSSDCRDEKDRKQSPASIKGETIRRGERDRKRSPGERRHSRSRSRSYRNLRHRHGSPVEDPRKSSHSRLHSSSRRRSRSPRSSHSRHSSHRRRSRPRSHSHGRDGSKSRHRRAFEKKPSKLSILEKLGIEIRPSASGPAVTPQLLLQQSIELQKQQVKSSTGIELPSYYNPAAVNPARYAEQIQKRRLLWGHKGKEQEKMPESGSGGETAAVPADCMASVSNNQWEATTFAQDQDGKMTAKFKRLMGIKESAANNPAAAGVDSNTLLQKQEELFTSMEMQYEVARLATHSQRGVGLGYGTFQYPR